MQYDVACEHETPGLASFLAAARAQFRNGNCILARATARDQGQFDDALLRDLCGIHNTASVFLQNAALAEALPELRLAETELPSSSVRSVGPLQLQGSLADILIRGGAYTHGIPEASARRLASDFVAELKEPGRPHFMLVLDGAWSPWFFDIAWDYSALVCNPLQRCWWLLTCTDTD